MVIVGLAGFSLVDTYAVSLICGEVGNVIPNPIVSTIITNSLFGRRTLNGNVRQLEFLWAHRPMTPCFGQTPVVIAQLTV